jgi:flagellar protein FlbT
LVRDFHEATTSDMVRDLLDRALKAAESDQCYQALKLARRVMRHEEVVLGLSPVSAVSAPEDVA